MVFGETRLKVLTKPFLQVTVVKFGYAQGSNKQIVSDTFTLKYLYTNLTCNKICLIQHIVTLGLLMFYFLPSEAQADALEFRKTKH